MATNQELLAWGLHYHNVGDLSQAEQYYRQILQTDPYHADAIHLLGEIAYRYGQYDTAVTYITRAIELNPYDGGYHSNLGVVYQAIGRNAESLASLQRARELQPHSPDVWNNLGVAHKNLGRLDEARACYREAIRLKPDFAFAYNNLGGVLSEQGKLHDAIDCYHQALRFKPNYAEAYNNLGNAYHGLERLDDAVACFQYALRLNPRDATAYNNLGIALGALGRRDEAVAAFHRAIEFAPTMAVAHNNLGATLGAQGKLAEATESYRRALLIDSNYAEAYHNLAGALADQGMIDEARINYEQALRLKPGNRLRIIVDTLLPMVYDSMGHLQAERQRLVDNIRRLTAAGVCMDLTHESAPNPFYLAYQGLNDRELLLELRRLYVPPALAAPIKHRPGSGKIRIGFISALFKDHTIGRLMKGLIANLSRDGFFVVVISSTTKPDAVTESIRQSADCFLSVPMNLPLARRLIAEQQLDVLFYTDIGMDPFTYTLAFSRLAPVQCVTWGHPDTTGLETIDYFLSSSLFEVDEADEHYSETLVRLKSLPAYAYRPTLPGPLNGRDIFGLSPDSHVYACLQSIFKFHPQFDELLAGILRRDPKGVLVVSEGYYPHWRELLLKRFRVTLADVLDRIRFMGWLKYDAFINLNAISDVLLDPMHFGGGRTSYEALASGLPIVTLPSQFLRGRMTLAMYKKMGMSDCIANSPEEYVDIAVKLGTEPDYRREVRSKILAANHVLYEDNEVVRELEAFFEEAVAKTI